MTMQAESSYTATLEIPKPASAAHFWIAGDYGDIVKITSISRVSEDDAKENIRKFSRLLADSVKP